MSKISHSAWEKYLTCPKMYDLHYNARLRPQGLSSALKFGVAIDEALNALLMGATLDKTIDVFRENFEWVDMSEVMWDSRDSDDVLVGPVKKFSGADEHSWASMRVKGRMLLEAYHREIFPLIEGVESVQKDLHNRPGVLDAIVQLRGHGRVLLDHKTSARPYDANAVTDSTQLALYAKDQGITKAGFAVLVKQIRKNTKKICRNCKHDGSYIRHKTCPIITNGIRCHGSWEESSSPEAYTQLLVDNVPDINKDLIEASISQVENAIQSGIYPHNLKACGKIYGKPCAYINYCWKNDKTGLIYKPDEEKK